MADKGTYGEKARVYLDNKHGGIYIYIIYIQTFLHRKSINNKMYYSVRTARKNKFTYTYSRENEKFFNRGEKRAANVHTKGYNII